MISPRTEFVCSLSPLNFYWIWLTWKLFCMYRLWVLTDLQSSKVAPDLQLIWQTITITRMWHGSCQPWQMSSALHSTVWQWKWVGKMSRRVPGFCNLTWDCNNEGRQTEEKIICLKVWCLSWCTTWAWDV